MREYFDRGLPSKTQKLHPASTSQQYMFDVARSRFTQALSVNMPAICEQFPEVAMGLMEVKTVLQSTPTRQFQVFHPEDASMTIDADSNAAFVR